MRSIFQHYTDNAEEYTRKYESISFEKVHSDWLEYVSNTKSLILDIGAGSGRDAAWFAEKGHEVVAVEPSNGMLINAQQLHPQKNIIWLEDQLPVLSEVSKLDFKFDLILLSAVWQHIRQSDRERSFRKIANLLKPGGLIVLTLRHGPSGENKESFPTSYEEIEHLARKYAVSVVSQKTQCDRFEREEVTWHTVVLCLPDDGTGALPLLRHIIINDAKSSTYKLALLRAIARVADGTQGMVIARDNEFVQLPFGLISLYWLKMYKKLILEYNFPQHPGSASSGFDTTAFRKLNDISDYDLRVGASFTGSSARNLHMALQTARDTIKKMPVTYTKYPNSNESIFKCISQSSELVDSIKLDFDFLRTLGVFKVPVKIWDAMSRYACWIEPSIISNWCALMASYDRKKELLISTDDYRNSLEWLDEQRSTVETRKIVENLVKKGKKIRCVWSAKVLTDDYSIDHCLPFSYWPNNDLWNLMPADKLINNKKLNRLPTARLLEDAKERIFDWWSEAYNSLYYQERFINEAKAALPRIRESSSLDTNSIVFSGIQIQRIKLKIDQQIKEWDLIR